MGESINVERSSSFVKSEDCTLDTVLRWIALTVQRD